MTKQEILFNLTQKFDIPAKSDAVINLDTALTFNKELSRYGKTLTLDAILNLATYSKKEIAKITKEMSEILDRSMGLSDFALSKPFYPDFPEQVMSASESELYLNAIIYYTFSQTDSKEMTDLANRLRNAMVGEATITRTPKSYDQIKDDLKPIGLAGENELEKQFKLLITGPNLSMSQYEYLKEYAKEEKDWMGKIFGEFDRKTPPEISSHETMAKLAMMIYEANDREKYQKLQKLLTKAEDVLRFAAVLSGNKVIVTLKTKDAQSVIRKLPDEYRMFATVKEGNIVSIRTKNPDPEKISDLWTLPGVVRMQKITRDYMDANLSFGIKNNKKLFKLSRPEQKVIKMLLENCGDLYFSIWQRKDMWQKLMRRLGTNDDRFPRVTDAFNKLHNKDKTLQNGAPVRPSPDKVLDGLLKEMNDIPDGQAQDDLEKKIKTYEKEYPGHFARNLTKIADTKCGLQIIAPHIINGALDKTPVYQLLKTAKFVEKSANWDYKVVTPKKGRPVILPVTEHEYLDGEKRRELVSLLKSAARRQLLCPKGKDVPETNKKAVWIDWNLHNRTLPLRNSRDASKGATLTKYSTVEGRTDKNIAAFGIFWKNDGGERADIDLSVAAFYEDGTYAGDCYYGNLRTPWAVHSGDYTSGMISEEINGAEEFIFVDKNILKENNIKYLIPEVHGFNRPFSEAKSVRFMFMEKQGGLDMMRQMEKSDSYSYDKEVTVPPCFDGEIINPAEIELSYMLTQKTNRATPFVYDVTQDKYIWLDQNIQIDGISNVRNKDGNSKTATAVYEAFHNDYPDMYTYAQLYAEANGLKVIQERADADIICTVKHVDRAKEGIGKDVEVIEPYNIYKLETLSPALPDREKEKEEEKETEVVETEDLRGFLRAALGRPTGRSSARDDFSR